MASPPRRRQLTQPEIAPSRRSGLRPVLNIVEAAIIVLGCAAVGFTAGWYRGLSDITRAAGRELEELQQKYGPARNSENGEEWIVRDFFGDRRDGYFVDVGANDYRRFSNTYYLETALGWSGLAIEPQTKFEADYRAHRARTTFLPLFVSDRSDDRVVLHVPGNDLEASINPQFATEGGRNAATPVTVGTATLDDILKAARATRIDFLNMDIELAEPAALRGFSIERFRPALVCVEGHPPIRQQILDYFATHGYTVVGKYVRADPQNLWFTPLRPHVGAGS